MTSNTLTANQYQKLANDIKKLINNSKNKIEDFAKKELTNIYLAGLDLQSSPHVCIK